ncbi:hypothetical protein SDC9_67392 [bioreactor metagenome]|uniref:Uncharacterized protein n=1 Tax=bioreactor metagenome TaxID=1076179 RepID=A0A644Y362_9ZZZZ
MDIFIVSFSVLNPLRYQPPSRDNDSQINFIEKIMEQLYQELIHLTLPTILLESVYDVNFTVELEKERKTILDWLTCRCSLEIEIDQVVESLGEKYIRQLSQRDIKTAVIEALTEELQCRILDYCVAINIAYPGFFEITNISTSYNDKPYPKSDTHTYICDLFDAYIAATDSKWPQINVLNIRNVWKWLSEKTHYFNGISITAIDRAINAFTYLFNPDKYEDLLYCLIGIESIYNSNESNAILEQIKVKCESLFGESASTKKELNQMYNIRSRFIHGQLNFPSKFTPYEGADDFNEFECSFLKTLQTAQSILLATIQKFVVNDAEQMITSITLDFK